MRRALPISLLAVTLLASSVAGAQIGLSQKRAGLGVKFDAPGRADETPVGEAVHVWRGLSAPEYSLFGGARELPRLGLHSSESYAGIVRPLSEGLAASFEVGYAPETLLAPRSYALTGQLHAALSDDQVLSVGIKYRVYDPDTAQRNGAASDITIGTGYTLAPYRIPGAALAPGYQLQFNYQYSAASTFGMALGRDLETYTPYLDVPGSGPRQLSFTGRYSLTPSWALSYNLLSQDAASPLRVQGLRLGLRYRF